MKRAFLLLGLLLPLAPLAAASDVITCVILPLGRSACGDVQGLSAWGDASDVVTWEHCVETRYGLPSCKVAVGEDYSGTLRDPGACWRASLRADNVLVEQSAWSC